MKNTVTGSTTYEFAFQDGTPHGTNVVVDVTPMLSEMVGYFAKLPERVKSDPPPKIVRAKAPKALHVRFGRQEFARLPCYRGVRPR